MHQCQEQEISVTSVSYELKFIDIKNNILWHMIYVFSSCIVLNFVSRRYAPFLHCSYREAPNECT